MTALRESQGAYAAQKVVIIKMQVETILQCTYVEDIRGQLQGQRIRRERLVLKSPVKSSFFGPGSSNQTLTC